jgi:hypothetical protein
VLKELKNRNGPGPDGPNLKLFPYEGIIPKQRLIICEYMLEEITNTKPMSCSFTETCFQK